LKISIKENKNNQTSEGPPTQQKGPDVSSTLTEPQLQISPNVSGIPPTPKKNVSKKSILIALLFLLIAVIIGGTYNYLLSQKQKSNTQKPDSKTTQKFLSPTPYPTENWEVFINSRYGYSLKYPSEIFDVVGGCCGSKETEENVYLINANSEPGKKDTLGRFEITFLPIDNYPENKDVQENLKLNLENFANHIWKTNNDSISTEKDKDKKVSSLIKTEYNGNEAYTFTLDKSLLTSSGGEVLDKEHKILISEDKNIKFIIKFPTDNPLFDQILSTFNFSY
jgi:hypothetical protein